MKKPKTVVPPLALPLMFVLLFLILESQSALFIGTAVSPPTPPALVRETGAVQASHTLFPELDESAVTAITVITPDRSFHFLCENPQMVSVNGQRADGEAFLTLLEQIAELPVDSRSAFAPQADQLLLTLTISSGQVQHTARFYADGKAGEKAHIISGPPNALQYRQTGGWRVGTLMMTCEGTRILDALGNETPMTQ